MMVFLVGIIVLGVVAANQGPSRFVAEIRPGCMQQIRVEEQRGTRLRFAVDQVQPKKRGRNSLVPFSSPFLPRSLVQSQVPRGPRLLKLDQRQQAADRIRYLQAIPPGLKNTPWEAKIRTLPNLCESR